MRVFTPVQALSAGALIALLAGCSEGSAIAPEPMSLQSGAQFPTGRVPSFLDINGGTSAHIVSHYSCPATGALEYVSYYYSGAINVFAGKFAGQGPCGQLTSGIGNVEGLFVQPGTHDLYAANGYSDNILVFHRGQATPYNTYIAPPNEEIFDVAVAEDGTVLATSQNSNLISTWIGGPNGGTYVGTYPMTNSSLGWYITVKKNGTVYYDDTDSTTYRGALWSMSCPAGACGAQTQVAGVSFRSPGGLEFDSTGDLLEANQRNIDTFELPNPKKSMLSVVGFASGMAVNKLDNHVFYTDLDRGNAYEYSYPGGVLIGYVGGPNAFGTYGIAVDH